MTSYLLSGPAAEPVTLAEAKAWLRLDGAAEDALLTTLITAARLHVESVAGLALLAQSWRLVLDEWPATRVIALPLAPLHTLTGITAYDAEGAATELSLAGVESDRTANPPRLFLPANFGPAPVLPPRQGIAIDFVAGFGDAAEDVPAPLRQAVLTLIGYWYENRDAVVVAGSGAVIPSGFDVALTPYKRVRL